MIIEHPRIVFSALRGNSGKTFLTVGVAACLRRAGKKVVPFKKGPDYIDPAWLAMAAGHPCRNLDLFLMERKGLISSFATHAEHADGALVEGNRGLFDGMDHEGRFSTAELAKLLDAPVVLVVDCSWATRTVAASVLGCRHFDPQVAIRGVILNRISGARHESMVRDVLEERCGVPVLGAIPKIEGGIFPERHMGLVPPREHPGAEQAVGEAARVVSRYVDVDRLWEVAGGAPDVRFEDQDGTNGEAFADLSERPRIGVIRDSAFWFYYPDNLEALEKTGASLVECSALHDRTLPPVDALYIGGGFPETHAAALAANAGFRESLREAVEDGLPVYAECGGLVYLGKELIAEGKAFPMAGVFPFRFAIDRAPQGHGYTLLKVDAPNPYFQMGQVLHGHEFHYSHIPDWEEGKFSFAFQVERGRGIHGQKDGLCYRNVLATYSHLHAIGAKDWARALSEQAVLYHRSNGLSEQWGEAPVVKDIRGHQNACSRQI